MTSRRDFFKMVAAAGAASALPVTSLVSAVEAVAPPVAGLLFKSITFFGSPVLAEELYEKYSRLIRKPQTKLKMELLMLDRAQPGVMLGQVIGKEWFMACGLAKYVGQDGYPDGMEFRVVETEERHEFDAVPLLVVMAEEITRGIHENG